MASRMKPIDWLEETMRLLVDEPDAVKVTEVKSDDGALVIYTIRCDKKDLGKVLGKQGKNIDNVRGVMSSIMWGLYQTRIQITVFDPNRQMRSEG